MRTWRGERGKVCPASITSLSTICDAWTFAATRAANPLGCKAVLGPTDVFEQLRADVDAQTQCKRQNSINHQSCTERARLWSSRSKVRACRKYSLQVLMDALETQQQLKRCYKFQTTCGGKESCSIACGVNVPAASESPWPEPRSSKSD